MSIDSADLALHAELDRFWQGVDQRTETPPGVDEAHTDTPTFSWGVFGTPLALPQPHYRLFIPTPYLVVGYGLLADVPGNAVVQVEHAFFNATGGTVNFGDVTGGAPPALVSQQAVVANTLSHWSPKRWGIYDLLHIYISSTLGLQELTFQLFCRRLPRVGGQSTVVTSGGGQVVTSAGVPVVLIHP